MRFGVLGHLEVVDGERTLTPGPAKHRVLLAALLLDAGQVVPVDRLVAAVWGAGPPPSAEPVLRVYVSALRKSLGAGFISTMAGGYRADVGRDAIDVFRFQELVAAAGRTRDAGDLAGASDVLREALALWRGEALADVESDELRRVHVPALEELRLTATEERIDLDLALGRHRDVVGELRRLVASYPLRERPRARLMLALDGSGRRSEALEAYREARAVLVGELGIEPGPELRAAHEAVLAAPKGDPEPVSVRRSVPPAETPSDLPDFTGRQEALGWLARQGPGCVVVYGAAGVGKTALAVHAAATLADRYPGGRLHAALRDADGTPIDPATVLEHFLRSLGCPDAEIPAGPQERVRLYRTLAAGRRLLVVLDDAAEEAQVRPLLPAASGCLALVTSRSPLTGLEAARAYELGVLSEDEALTLLARVAGRERVTAEPEAAGRMVALCDRLPLAVRIAGARLARRTGWTLGHLVGRLADERRRLDELSAGDLAVRGSLEFGYRGLSAAEARLFRLLGLLSAPHFAAWVAGPLLGVPDDAGERLVEQLVESGLLQPIGLDAAGRERHRFHDLTRLYARELCAAERMTALPAAFGDRLLTLSRSARALLTPADPGSGETIMRTGEEDLPGGTREIRESGDWLGAERDFLVCSVTDLARYGRPEQSWRLAFYLAEFFEARAHHDDWIRTHSVALEAARAAGSPRGEGLLLRGLADVQRLAGRTREAERALTSSLELLRGDGVQEAQLRRRLGLVRLAQGRLPEAAGLLASALAVFEGGDPRGVADTLRDLGVVRLRMGDPGSAVPVLERSAATCRDLADPRGEAAALRELAAACLAARQAERAAAHAEHATGISRRLRDPLATARGLYVSAQIAQALGRSGVASSAAVEAAGLFEEYGRQQEAAAALALVGTTMQILNVPPVPSGRHIDEQEDSP
ncbi:BTAD domain-containing putative transcriptional regulator [Streptosporangium soli]|nr:tetratricopeptide repeat protein [Streptosporangium sp. KLBMP 9127]